MNTYRAQFKVPGVDAAVVFEIRAGDRWEAVDAVSALELHLDLDFMYFEGE